MVMHYAPTATRTMCGQLITERVHWIGSFEDWLTDLRALHPDVCWPCVRFCKSYPRLRIPTEAALFARLREIRDNGGKYTPRPPARRMG